VALYNVIHKAAINRSDLSDVRGFNKPVGRITLTDHTARHIARPNNDTLIGGALLDLRAGPVILQLPTFDSHYVSLEVCGYDHYCDVILSTRTGDFAKPTRVLFYTVRTKGYDGAKVSGVDRIVKLTCDFARAAVRVMPHLSEQDRFESIVAQIKAITVLPLSAFQGKPATPVDAVQFPAFGKTDTDLFGTNLLEVMQFVFNYTTFDLKDEIDQGVLAVYKPLGVEPGKQYNPNKVARIDHALFRTVTEQAATEELAKLGNPNSIANFLGKLFRPKGQMELDELVCQSAVGPLGLPSEEATYGIVPTTDGKPMNAKHDYVIRMTKDELPPAKAFWSFTLYDTQTGFFIPNDQKKYSVGHNAGMRLNKDRGIDIYITAEKPSGVPEEIGCRLTAATSKSMWWCACTSRTLRKSRRGNCRRPSAYQAPNTGTPYLGVFDWHGDSPSAAPDRGRLSGVARGVGIGGGPGR
jgi:hypothetical protein